MKLYMAPGACSLADHIALHEAKMEFERVKVDTKTKQTEHGEDYMAINPKGYVPTLELDDGQRLTENIAILSWVAQRTPALVPPGDMGPVRLLEMLAFISTEIHKQFGRIFKPSSEAEAEAARQKIATRFDFLASTLTGDYLFGQSATVADAYLFVMLLWAKRVKLDVPAALQQFGERMKARPAVELALKHEGLETA
ncbi:glutathione binding-like protein [Robbsia sp. Bb-Pol-6]|uniref:Glutathione binding-like protein n=1 Tax=Robbsia betulipollinis TaxID=2981849 RepID=A0ABT3ZS68_9BURK|nr:glutathione binding-like protein [Robbsia betulipollinis]MCY0389389.1 glutathione binding-like protein [Robbsia betulipollinis]